MRFDQLVSATAVIVLVGCTSPVDDGMDPDAGSESTDADGASDSPGADRTPSETDPCRVDDPTCDPPLGTPPPRPRDCEPGTEWIYLIGYEVTGTPREDAPRHLLKYQPNPGTVTVIGDVDCGAGFAPFSMAVDRDGIAWVLSARNALDGLFRVDTTDASCEPTAYIPDQGGYEEYGMGFAADARDSTAESLYVIGGPRTLIHAPGAENLFGVLDLDTLTIETRARIAGGGELTGTGEGNLWGLLSTTEGDVITLLDPLTGVRSTTYPIGTSAFARAVAFWGGDFYLFLSDSIDVESRIVRLRSRTGRLTDLGPVTGHVIAGAGVSTCAPYVLL
jgi:hypothetical protein